LFNTEKNLYLNKITLIHAFFQIFFKISSNINDWCDPIRHNDIISSIRSSRKILRRVYRIFHFGCMHGFIFGRGSRAVAHLSDLQSSRRLAKRETRLPESRCCHTVPLTYDRDLFLALSAFAWKGGHTSHRNDWFAKEKKKKNKNVWK